MPVVVTGEFFKKDVHAPMQTHCRLDGGPRLKRAVRVVLIRKANTQRWVGLVSDSPAQVGVSVSNAAQEYIEAACRLPSRPLFPTSVAWFQRDSQGSFDRLQYSGNGVGFTELQMPNVPARSYEAMAAAFQHEGIDADNAYVSEAIRWALTD
ncbi:hypothetical protein HDG34_003247 [Paraburkholderia sp. HC6.4b]|uniref:hypothetical protein n=1 Tax=unclassified Paraburkholderia TaxID=2615204 RepID=UPI001615CFA7|nr:MULTISPECIES: hypothetical protein [unclassified Paraburkholderia]MBB5409306.1 hypothetical protein [Paraburkholderia sp. HC6.4b]MBB5451034.1 hypothetical protein [Paraburkholderia sp. Kb1A]